MECDLGDPHPYAQSNQTLPFFAPSYIPEAWQLCPPEHGDAPSRDQGSMFTQPPLDLYQRPFVPPSYLWGDLLDTPTYIPSHFDGTQHTEFSDQATNPDPSSFSSRSYQWMKPQS